MAETVNRRKENGWKEGQQVSATLAEPETEAKSSGC